MRLPSLHVACCMLHACGDGRLKVGTPASKFPLMNPSNPHENSSPAALRLGQWAAGKSHTTHGKGVVCSAL